MIIRDGVGDWYRGPEWDKVAEESMRLDAHTVELYAQANAPWSDRTGEARTGLVAEVSQLDGKVYLELAHSVDYGEWLEVIQNGKFAIIDKTLEHFAPQTFTRAANKVSEARRGSHPV